MAEPRVVSQAQAELLAAFHVQAETTKLLLQSLQEQLRKIFERLDDLHDTIYIGNGTPALRTQTRELTQAVADLRAQTRALTQAVADLRTRLQVTKTVPAITLPARSTQTQATLRVALISAATTIVVAFIGGAVAWHGGAKVTRLLYYLLDNPLPWSR